MIGLPTKVASRMSLMSMSGFAGDAGGEAVDGLAHDAGHVGIAARIHHDVGDAAHQVFAEADLRVHDAGRGHDIAGRQFAEMAGDGGGADVEGEAVGLVVEARPHRGDLLAVMDGDGDGPIALAQRLLQVLDDPQVAVEPGQAPLRRQRLHQPLQVAGGIVHVGLDHLDIVQAHDRIELDGPHLRALAHHLLVDLAVGRHVDDEVALQQRRAAEAAPVLEAAPIGVALLDGAESREVGRLRVDAELGELALADLDLAAPADAAPAAHRIDIDAEAARRLQDRRPQRKPPALARGHEHDEGIGMGAGGAHEFVLTLAWIDTVRPSRRPLRGLLRMRKFLVPPKLRPILRSERSERLEGRKMLMQPYPTPRRDRPWECRHRRPRGGDGLRGRAGRRPPRRPPRARGTSGSSARSARHGPWRRRRP